MRHVTHKLTWTKHQSIHAWARACYVVYTRVMSRINQWVMPHTNSHEPSPNLSMSKSVKCSIHSALQCIAVCCSVLQCVAVCCSMKCSIHTSHVTYEWIMSNINASRHTQTHMNQAPIHPCMSKSVLCGLHTSHVTYQSMSHDTHELTCTTHQSIPQQERAMLQQASLGVSVKFSEILKSHISTADVYYRFR